MANDLRARLDGHSAAHRLLANKAAAREIVATLSNISRSRALSLSESLLLEREMAVLDQRKIPRNVTRSLARLGIKRDMGKYVARAALKDGGE